MMLAEELSERDNAYRRAISREILEQVPTAAVLLSSVVKLGVGGVTEVKPTLPKSLGNVKPVRSGGKYEYLPPIYISINNYVTPK
jgi:hypothetical protein